MGEFDDCDAIDEAANQERWVLDLQDRLAAAEQRAAVAEAALRQAQEDGRLVAGLAYALDQNEFFSDVLGSGSAGLAYEERRRMDVLCSKFARAPHDETVAALRRILASVPR